MKISFSTRGWKELTWDELKEVAIEMDFAGIEVYDLHCCKELTDKGAAFHKYNTQATVRGLRDAKLEIPCFDTSIDITSDENSVDTLKEYDKTQHSQGHARFYSASDGPQKLYL